MGDELKDGLLSVKRAAAYLGISTQTLYRRHPEIPRIRIGARVLFQRGDLDLYINQHRSAKAVAK
jgi:excisionase family DNA binding protein